MEEKIESALYQLLAEMKLINGLLKELVDRLGHPVVGNERFKTDATAFGEYWQQAPFRDEDLPNLIAASRAWNAALAWERGRKK